MSFLVLLTTPRCAVNYSAVYMEEMFITGTMATLSGLTVSEVYKQGDMNFHTLLMSHLGWIYAREHLEDVHLLCSLEYLTLTPNSTPLI